MVKDRIELIDTIIRFILVIAFLKIAMEIIVIVKSILDI